jgi:hypothetical protein
LQHTPFKGYQNEYSTGLLKCLQNSYNFLESSFFRFAARLPTPVAAQSVRAQAPAQTPVSGPTAGGGVRLANGWWRCVCGKENAPYVSSCSCGRSKRDVIK